MPGSISKKFAAITVVLACIVFSTSLDAYAQSSEFRYEQLVQIITDNNCRSINDLLPRLPASIRGVFLLIPRTQSLQEGSDDKPRIVLYDGVTDPDSDPSTARSIYAFAGEEPSGDDVNEDIEVIRFREPAKVFDFFRVKFRKVAGTWQAPVFEDGMTGHDPKPPGCGGCHRGSQAADDREMRPNFSTYPAWTSIYGTDDHHVFNGMGQQERTRFNSFLANGRSSFRYMSLQNLVTSDDVQGVDQVGTHRLGGGRSRSLGNNFHRAINIHNNKRIVKFMTESPDYRCYKWAIQGALKAACQDQSIRDFIPASRRVNHTTAYNDVLSDTETKQRDYYTAKRDQLVQAGMSQAYANDANDFSLRGEADDRYRIAKLRYVFETRDEGSVSIEHFAMVRRNSSYAFLAPTREHDELAALFAQESGLGDLSCQGLRDEAANAEECRAGTCGVDAHCHCDEFCSDRGQCTLGADCPPSSDGQNCHPDTGGISTDPTGYQCAMVSEDLWRCVASSGARCVHEY